MIAYPAPKYHASPSHAPAAPPRPASVPVCPSLGPPRAGDEVHGRVGNESTHPRAGLTPSRINDVAQIPT